MNYKHILLTSIAMILTLSCAAQFKFSGEFRPRSEYSHGYGQLADVDQMASLFTSQRTRLNLDFNTGIVTTRLVLQDIRIWGSQRQLVTNEDFGVSIHEAWAETKILSNLSLRVGRQELVYDNHRIFGNVAWAQQGRSHDLTLFRYRGVFEADAGFAYHESGDRSNNFYLGPDAYKFMQFLWLHKKIDKLSASILLLNNGVPKNTLGQDGKVIEQTTLYTHTIGSYAEYKSGPVTLSGNAYYQTGELVNGKDLSAYEYLIEGSWKMNDALTTGIAFEYLSGTDSDEQSTVARSFNPLYGTNHKFNGHMDYFYVGNHIGSVGLKDLTTKVAYQPGKVKLNLDVHGFWSAASINQSAQTYLGTELDLAVSLKINAITELAAGYSHMFATSSMELLKGGSASEIQNWAWVMITVKPSDRVTE